MIESMLKHSITPVVPQQGSVGASGDLAPLAHMAAAMIGEGDVLFKGERMAARQAMAEVGMEPIALGPKEGLGLINGTQFSTACALTGLFGAWRNAAATIVTAALSTDAIMGSTAPLVDEIHTLRGHQGSDRCGPRHAINYGWVRNTRKVTVKTTAGFQDPYCIRCQPQVTGAAIDLLHFAGRTLETKPML